MALLVTLAAEHGSCTSRAATCWNRATPALSESCTYGAGTALLSCCLNAARRVLLSSDATESDKKSLGAAAGGVTASRVLRPAINIVPTADNGRGRPARRRDPGTPRGTEAAAARRPGGPSESGRATARQTASDRGGAAIEGEAVRRAARGRHLSPQPETPVAEEASAGVYDGRGANPGVAPRPSAQDRVGRYINARGCARSRGDALPVIVPGQAVQARGGHA